MDVTNVSCLFHTITPLIKGKLYTDKHFEKSAFNLCMHYTVEDKKFWSDYTFFYEG
jgi:hypothetical protein